MTSEQIDKNYEYFIEKVTKFGDETTVNTLIESIGGEENLKKAVFGSTTDSGVAYDGSLLACAKGIEYYAKKINDLLPASVKADEDSIEKVAFLSHLAKALMFSENDNNWEKTNRGIIYKFNKLDGALRCGERSILLAMNAGFKFTTEEYEAMRIMDKTTDDDNYTKFYSSTLSNVIRQANDIILLIKHVR